MATLIEFWGSMALHRYDRDHMPPDKSALNWDALTLSQPTAALIPDALRAWAKGVEMAAGETLFRIGDPVGHAFLVLSGEARLIRRDRQGSEVILQRSRGGFIAEASLDSSVYHCDAVATQPGTLLLFPADAFRNALEEDALFRKAWQSLLAREVRKLRAQCERLSLHGAASRIAHYIESEGVDGAVTLTQSRKAWAAELGLTHEALYRALRRMQDAGMLAVQGNRIATVP